MMRRLSSVQPATVQPAAVQSAAVESATESSRTRSARRGFSMVELLIVITIIAILVSLLLVGVQAAVGRARVATVVSELKNLEQAIKAFESEFGMQPPSFILLYEDASGWTAGDPWTRASRSIIRQLWKDYDFTQDVDFDGDNVSNKVYRLTGAECLVFFLGGMVSVDNSVTPPVYTPKGFSKVPSAPFGRQSGALTGARSGPFYEFKSTQLLSSIPSTTGTTNPAGMYVYLDAIPGQTRPIQYFSSYGGSGYRVYGTNGQLGASASSTEAGDNEAFYDTFGWVYTKTPGNPSATPPLPPEPYNPNTFQLISPGLDGEYGDANLCGGYVHATNGVQGVPTFLPPGTLPAGGQLSKTPANITRERDNITNFAGGEIH